MNCKFLTTLLLTAVIITACRRETYHESVLEQESSESPETARYYIKIPTQNYYFDFDEALYYSGTELQTHEIFVKDGQPDRSVKDSIAMEIISDWRQESSEHKEMMRYIDSIGFKKQLIPSGKHAALKEILREKNYYEDSTVTACAPIFRDIYLFKKKGKIIGIAKLCYGCGQHLIIGTEANTNGFGKNGEYEKLANIVNRPPSKR